MRAGVPQPVDTVESAQTAGLRYITGCERGISRRRAGKGFIYVNSNGGIIRQPSLLARIRTLRIPPAWTNVWICSDARGHLQAVGRDARNRKQYLTTSNTVSFVIRLSSAEWSRSGKPCRDFAER